MIVDASIIIPTHNRIEMLKSLLESISYSTVFPLEVVVVDDGSDKEIASEINIAEYPFRLEIIRNSVSKGPSKTRNIGARHSRGSILVFTDDDCIVDKTWFETLVSTLQNSETMLGGIGGTIHAYEKDIFSRYYEVDRIFEPSSNDKNHPKRMPYLVAANCAVKRDIFMKAGGFDEDIKIASSDDWVMSLRIAKMGYFFEKEAAAVVWHQFRTGLENFYRTFYIYGLGARYVAEQYLISIKFKNFRHICAEYKKYRKANITFFDSFRFVLLTRPLSHRLWRCE